MIKSLEGFKKIKSQGGSLQTSILYNTTTKELKRIITDDLEYQYGDGLIDREFSLDELEEISDMQIDKEALKQYNIDNGIIFVGCRIEVFKGRKIPKGTISKVIDIKPYYDQYHRWQADYVYLENGMKTNIDNCKIVNNLD